MKYYKFVLFLLLVFSVSWSCGQTSTTNIEVNFYLPWRNNLNSLVKVAAKEEIPILNNGKNYRIVEVKNRRDHDLKLSEITNNFSNVAVKCFYLPVIKSYKGNQILDVVIPDYENVVIKKGESSYFLIEFKAQKSGIGNGNILFKFNNNENVKLATSVFVGNTQFSHQLNVNVWCYFDYDLIKGLKTKVITDLEDHGVNVLVIPPYKLPNIRNSASEGNQLVNYLTGTKNKFDHYLLFLNYRTYNNSSFVLSKQWETNFQNWLLTVKGAFEKCGIDFNKVMLYPYDEPTRDECNKLIALKSWCKAHNINIPFYSTVGNSNALNLEENIQTLQVNTKVKLPNSFKKMQNVDIWEYEIKAQSRDVPALNYLNFSWRAFRDGATGIGIWNYADVKKSYPSNSLNTFSALKSTQGSWQVRQTDVSRDYSCVYRKGDNLYSSIRWEAISMTQQDYNFLLLYQRLYGEQKALGLAQGLINGSISLANWERQKLFLLKR